MRIGILGGTFDPIHIGHLAIARTAVAELSLERLLIIPSRTPPHKPQPSTTPQQRLDMCRLGCGDIAQCEISDIELRRDGPSYTIDTLRALAAPDHQLLLLLGVDAVQILPQWYQAHQIGDYAELVMVARSGSAPLDQVQLVAALPSLAGRIHTIPGPGMDVSSSDIRARCARGASIAGLVHPAVAAYIATHQLYQATSNT